MPSLLDPSGWTDLQRAPGSGAHTLLVADADGLRAGAAAWIAHELAGGSKVLVKGWLGRSSTIEQHWLFGPAGLAAAPEHVASGQLEIVDYATVIERCGGTTSGLDRLRRDEITRAGREGWATVAMTQESTFRRLDADGAAAELVEQERGYDRLARRWPVNTLCQLAVDQESEVAVRASVAVHHREVVAAQWCAMHERGWWRLSGELDVAVGREVAAGLLGALSAPGDAPGDTPGLDVDLGRVTFLDSSCATSLMWAAGSAAGRPVTLHRIPASVREVLELVGRPPSVTFANRC